MQNLQNLGAASASLPGLLTARDGMLPGTWGQPATPPDRPFGAPENLAAWPEASQRAILTAEVLSRLSFGHNTDTVRVFLSTFTGLNTEQPAAAISPLASLTAPTPPDFAHQAEVVYNYADLRPDRIAEIADQLGGLLPYFASVCGFEPGRMPLTLKLLTLAQDCAVFVAQQCKHRLACRRPDALSPLIQPMISTPGHGSLPSGHATEAFAMAETLRRLIPDALKTKAKDDGTRETDTQLMHVAARIAVNRTVAGVHFPADSFAGALLGLTVADAIAARAGADVPNRFAAFDGRGIGREDFYLSRIWQSGTRHNYATDEGSQITRFVTGGLQTDRSDLLQHLWSGAQEEWLL
ncbi:MAG: phosphatase PAP2 family protein [Pseudomonadota bacterium]